METVLKILYNDFGEIYPSRRRITVKILKKSKGKWIAVSLGLAVQLCVVNGVSAQESVFATPIEATTRVKTAEETLEALLDAYDGLYTQPNEEDVATSDPLIHSESLPSNEVALSETLLIDEQDKAREHISNHWTANSVDQIKQEVARQSQVGLPEYVIQWGDTLNRIALAVEKTEITW